MEKAVTASQSSKRWHSLGMRQAACCRQTSERLAKSHPTRPLGRAAGCDDQGGSRLHAVQGPRPPPENRQMTISFIHTRGKGAGTVPWHALFRCRLSKQPGTCHRFPPGYLRSTACGSLPTFACSETTVSGVFAPALTMKVLPFGAPGVKDLPLARTV